MAGFLIFILLGASRACEFYFFSSFSWHYLVNLALDKPQSFGHAPLRGQQGFLKSLPEGLWG